MAPSLPSNREIQRFIPSLDVVAWNRLWMEFHVELYNYYWLNGRFLSRYSLYVFDSNNQIWLKRKTYFRNPNVSYRVTGLIQTWQRVDYINHNAGRTSPRTYSSHISWSSHSPWKLPGGNCTISANSWYTPFQCLQQLIGCKWRKISQYVTFNQSAVGSVM